LKKNPEALKLLFSETKAEIVEPENKYIKTGSTLKLTCRVYLGADGPGKKSTFSTIQTI